MDYAYYTLKFFSQHLTIKLLHLSFYMVYVPLKEPLDFIKLTYDYSCVDSIFRNLLIYSSLGALIIGIAGIIFFNPGVLICWVEPGKVFIHNLKVSFKFFILVFTLFQCLKLYIYTLVNHLVTGDITLFNSVNAVIFIKWHFLTLLSLILLSVLCVYWIYKPFRKYLHIFKYYVMLIISLELTVWFIIHPIYLFYYLTSSTDKVFLFAMLVKYIFSLGEFFITGVYTGLQVCIHNLAQLNLYEVVYVLVVGFCSLLFFIYYIYWFFSCVSLNLILYASSFSLNYRPFLLVYIYSIVLLVITLTLYSITEYWVINFLPYITQNAINIYNYIDANIFIFMFWFLTFTFWLFVYLVSFLIIFFGFSGNVPVFFNMLSNYFYKTTVMAFGIFIFKLLLQNKFILFYVLDFNIQGAYCYFTQLCIFVLNILNKYLLFFIKHINFTLIWEIPVSVVVAYMICILFWIVFYIKEINIILFLGTKIYKFLKVRLTPIITSRWLNITQLVTNFIKYLVLLVNVKKYILLLLLVNRFIYSNWKHYCAIFLNLLNLVGYLVKASTLLYIILVSIFTYLVNMIYTLVIFLTKLFNVVLGKFLKIWGILSFNIGYIISYVPYHMLFLLNSTSVSILTFLTFIWFNLILLSNYGIYFLIIDSLKFITKKINTFKLFFTHTFLMLLGSKYYKWPNYLRLRVSSGSSLFFIFKRWFLGNKIRLVTKLKFLFKVINVMAILVLKWFLRTTHTLNLYLYISNLKLFTTVSMYLTTYLKYQRSLLRNFYSLYKLIICIIGWEGRNIVIILLFSAALAGYLKVFYKFCGYYMNKLKIKFLLVKNFYNTLSSYFNPYILFISILWLLNIAYVFFQIIVSSSIFKLFKLICNLYLNLVKSIVYKFFNDNLVIMRLYRIILFNIIREYFQRIIIVGLIVCVVLFLFSRYFIGLWSNYIKIFLSDIFWLIVFIPYYLMAIFNIKNILIVSFVLVNWVAWLIFKLKGYVTQRDLKKHFRQIIFLKSFFRDIFEFIFRVVRDNYTTLIFTKILIILFFLWSIGVIMDLYNFINKYIIQPILFILFLVPSILSEASDDFMKFTTRILTYIHLWFYWNMFVRVCLFALESYRNALISLYWLIFKIQPIKTLSTIFRRIRLERMRRWYASEDWKIYRWDIFKLFFTRLIHRIYHNLYWKSPNKKFYRRLYSLYMISYRRLYKLFYYIITSSTRLIIISVKYVYTNMFYYMSFLWVNYFSNIQKSIIFITCCFTFYNLVYKFIKISYYSVYSLFNSVLFSFKTKFVINVNFVSNWLNFIIHKYLYICSYIFYFTEYVTFFMFNYLYIILKPVHRVIYCTWLYKYDYLLWFLFYWKFIISRFYIKLSNIIIRKYFFYRLFSTYLYFISCFFSWVNYLFLYNYTYILNQFNYIREQWKFRAFILLMIRWILWKFHSLTFFWISLYIDANYAVRLLRYYVLYSMTVIKNFFNFYWITSLLKHFISFIYYMFVYKCIIIFERFSELVRGVKKKLRKKILIFLNLLNVKVSGCLYYISNKITCYFNIIYWRLTAMRINFIIYFTVDCDNIKIK